MLGTTVIQKLMSGWAHDLTTSNSTAVEPLADFQYSKSYALTWNRPGQAGNMAPGYVFDAITDSGTRVNEKPLNGAIASNGEVFSVLRNARLVKFGLLDDTVDANYDLTVAGTHAAHTVTASDNPDVLVFKDRASTPAEYILTSYEDGTDADISLIKSDGTGQDTDWFSTRSGGSVLTKGVPLKMWTGPDAIHYCTNGQYIASINILGDATGATSADVVTNAQALNLGTGWVATSGCMWDEWSAIVAYKATAYPLAFGFARSEARLYLWNGTDPTFTKVYDLGDYYVTAIYNDNGRLKLFTQGRDNTMKIREFNGATADIVFESVQAGSAPLHGSVERWYGMLTWGNSSGQLNAYGSVVPGIAEGFHNIGGAANIGMVKNFQNAYLYIGDKNNTTYTIRKVNFAKYTTSATLRSALYELPPDSTISSIRFHFARPGSIQVSLFKGYVDTAIGGANDLLNLTLTSADLQRPYFHRVDTNIPNLDSFYLFITFNHASDADAAIIRKIEVDYTYEPTN